VNQSANVHLLHRSQPNIYKFNLTKATTKKSLSMLSPNTNYSIQLILHDGIHRFTSKVVHIKTEAPDVSLVDYQTTSSTMVKQSMIIVEHSSHSTFVESEMET